MPKKNKSRARTRPHPKMGPVTVRTGRAPTHRPLSNDAVHVFVDDQNLFFGIVNDRYGKGFRIDFGRLLLEAARAADGHARIVASAYIAGVVPDDDSFWEVAKSRGFEVRRGYLGARHRSKQDDAWLIADVTETVCDKPGPSTVVLCAGDADYVPPLTKALARGWRSEILFIDRGVSSQLEPVAHEIRALSPASIQHMPM